MDEPSAGTVADGPDGSDAAPVGVFSEARPWLAHYSAGVPTDIALPEQPLTWLLDEAVRTRGANVAIEYYGTKLTYVQLAALVDRFARALLRLGLQRGARVALCLPNAPQFPIAVYGILKAGGVAVPTHPLYTAPELEHQLNDSGATMIVTLDMFYPTLAAVRGRTPPEHALLPSPPHSLPPALPLP